MSNTEEPLSAPTGSGTRPALGVADHAIWVLPVLIVVIDQLSKLAVATGMHLGQTIPVLGQWLRLRYILNPGGAFGIQWWHNGVYYVAALLVIGWIVRHLWLHGREHLLSVWALALILGGAVGNLIDRIVRGEVIDFLDVEFPDMTLPSFDFGIVSHSGYQMDRWPTFNVADSAVTIGVLLLLITLWRDPHILQRRKTPMPATPGTESPLTETE